MEIIETRLVDCKLFKPKVFEDERGYFYEGFNKQLLKKELDIDFNIVQINQSKSARNVLRGIHFQAPPFDQAKLVSVIEGEVLDVAVDLRKNSATYGQWESVLLSNDNKRHFFIPRGFGHAFVVLSENAKFMYGVDNNYSPGHDSGIIYSDSDLAIDWKVEGPIIVSEKDQNLQPFKNFKTPFL